MENFKTQPVGKALQDAAAIALGGQPARPPALPEQKISAVTTEPAPTAHEPAAAADPFRQGIRVAAAVPPPSIGHPTFDSTPPDVLARREKIDALRARLGGLATQIKAANTELQPVLAALKDDPAGALAEGFDPEVASQFLSELDFVVGSLTTPAKAAEEASAE